MRTAILLAACAFGAIALTAQENDFAARRIQIPRQRALNVSRVSAEYGNNLIVAWDGSVWGWAGIPEKPTPVTGLIGVIGVAGSNTALNRDGTVWEWEATHAPSQVNGLTEIVAIAEGGSFNTVYLIDPLFRREALKADGTVWTWTDVDRSVQMPGLTEVTAIAAGYDHRLALRADGTVWAWGANICGQLGNGRLTVPTSPPNWSEAIRVDGISGVVAISAGGSEGDLFSFGHSLALKADGTVWEWGCNGTGIPQPTPMRISSLSDIVAIAAGGEHSLALKNDGTLWAWGWNYYGQLGDGTRTTTSDETGVIKVPVQVSGLSDVLEVAAGGDHNLAVRSDGTVWIWGDGQLVPRQVSGLPTVMLPPTTMPPIPGRLGRRF